MPRLSDLQLASLLEEIAASMRVNMPIADAMQRLRARRLGAVARAAGRIADRLEQGTSLADSIQIVESPLVSQAVAAIRGCEKSGDPSLLSHVAIQLRTRYESNRSARISWLYPFVLLLVGYIVAIVVMAPMVRRNASSGFGWSPWVVDLCEWLEEGWVIPPIIFIVLLIALLLWQIIGKKMPTDASRQLFFRSLADQFQHDVPEDEAIRNAAAMAGDSELMAETSPTLQSPTVLRRISATNTPFSTLHDALSQKDTLLARLRYASEVHRERARKHNYFWGRLAPRIAMVLIGGGLTVSYAWWIIRPVYQQVASW